ncbi:riboflavin kinase/fmn adenylyltransferase-like protein [Leishmania major strain Friedlin]|uniref:riboflavin kinase n=1 Tax=Leishmania major TaxID=5664 RepID=E9AFE0_LEIMA|nr:riboflavin kinase/fmn adenylyltransferase-like protein [Leishmania major strain Friedlin]CAG9582671.1 riboflavin_kinase/fmn_adenylyltransferase-like_protein [Leishmania major strain Friedlin]CBZ12944.1 riboflavin kinase/fmn adenylyltransferase-like protein [Leishmania major strain Friedlin]|eukprot:XP_003722710.1 riboflavin kinase/fmn adenylyltransferase-like protein [Leishmania major strain Friedlin]
MRPWFLRGRVIHGFGRGGTQLGYPTANLELSEAAIDFLKPYDNFVLWGWGCVEAAEPNTWEAHAEDASHAPLGPFPFVMSIGNNPQFKNVDVSAEVHFLHKFDGDFYGRVVRIITLERIRSQSAFTTLEELIRTIDCDVVFAEEHLKMPEWAPYGQHEMVNPCCVPAQLRGAAEAPSFGFLEL